MIDNALKQLYGDENLLLNFQLKFVSIMSNTQRKTHRANCFLNFLILFHKKKLS